MKIKLRNYLLSWKIVFIFFISCIFFSSFYLTFLFFHKEFDFKDFRYRYPLTLSSRLTSTSINVEEISGILSQRFYYLDKGKQMTAFESEDHQYVIKFFNPRPFLKDETFQKIKKIKALFSLKWISYAYLNRKDRLQRLAKIYDEAFDHFKDQSALVYVGVSKPSFATKDVTFLDKKGREITVDISMFPFVLQRKVNVAQKYLLQLIKEGSVAKAKACIESLADLFITRASLGYTDRIQTLHNNYGFEGERAVQIDLGRLRKYDSSGKGTLDEVDRVLLQLEDSVNNVIPEMQTFIHELLLVKKRELNKGI